MNTLKLVVVDDEPDMAGFVHDVAEQAGFAVEQFHNADVFREQYKPCADVIVLDLMMPGTDGVELIRFLSEVGCDSLLVLISGFDPGVLHSAQKLAIEHGLNIAGSLSKPFRHHELQQLLHGLSISPRRPSHTTPDKPLVVDELREALKSDQLVVHYQPQLSIRDRSLVGAEALVRWQHPTHGLLGPELFITMAERHGLIDDLTWVVLQQAMQQCRNWLDNDLKIRVAVNMSATTLKHLELPERIHQLVRKYRLQPSQIVLEVTENALMQELIKSLDILTRLRMKNFRLSIDDFGTGYSSMVQLHRAPFSEIKIDRSFIMEMDYDAEARAIVETIIMLGDKLGMSVIAEGVETQAEWDRLAALGCGTVQGYLVAKPMPAADFTDWLAQHYSRNPESTI